MTSLLPFSSYLHFNSYTTTSLFTRHYHSQNTKKKKTSFSLLSEQGKFSPPSSSCIYSSSLPFLETFLTNKTAPVKPIEKITSNASSKLLVSDLVQRILSLPIGERVKVLDLFEYNDTNLTISDYNDVLLALLKAGEYESVISLFGKLYARGLCLDSWSYSLMIRCYCKNNEPEKGKEVLHVMVGKDLYPNAVTFTILVDCFCKKGRLKKAFEVLETMSKVGVEPTIRTYNGLINGMCYVGRLEEANELLNKIKSSKISPDIYTFTLIIDGYCKVGRTDKAVQLLDEALKIGLKPNVITYNSILNGYCKEGRPLEGVELLRRMDKEAIRPDFITYTTLLRGLLVCSDSVEALKIYKRMIKEGIDVEERAMNTLLRGLCRLSMTSMDHDLLKEAKGIFQRMVEKGHVASPYTYCLVVQALAKGGEIDEALDSLLAMIKNDYSPRLITYNIVLRVLCEEGRINDAYNVLVIMIENGTFPSRFSFIVLLEEFKRRGRVLEALGVHGIAIKMRVSLKKIPRKKTDGSKVFDYFNEKVKTIDDPDQGFKSCSSHPRFSPKSEI